MNKRMCPKSFFLIIIKVSCCNPKTKQNICKSAFSHFIQEFGHVEACR